LHGANYKSIGEHSVISIQRSRRYFMLALSSAVLAAGARSNPRAGSADAPSLDFSAIEARLGGRVGVAALDSGTGKRVGYRAAERFPMCSTFKLPAVAAVLARVDAGSERLDHVLPYGPADLLEYAPITRAHFADGGMRVDALCEAAICYSDNTAANLLLATLDGPSGLTSRLRKWGDLTSRLDRNEPTLNEAVEGDPRDTTTPAAMLADMRKILLGDVLSDSSRALITGWLVGNTTGNARLRAGLPGSWRVGDKTGTGERGASSDVAIVWPPGRKAILISAYLHGSQKDGALRNAALADIARSLSAHFST
jgi:beta-lactamase class A